MTRQAEMGMIQPCSKDGGRQGETQMARRSGVGGVYTEHMAERSLKRRGTERKRRSGAAGDVIVTTNGEFIYTVQRNSPGLGGGGGGGGGKNVLIENNME